MKALSLSLITSFILSTATAPVLADTSNARHQLELQTSSHLSRFQINGVDVSSLKKNTLSYIISVGSSRNDSGRARRELLNLIEHDRKG